MIIYCNYYCIYNIHEKGYFVKKTTPLAGGRFWLTRLVLLESHSGLSVRR
jgi:hypothetical protein